VEAKPGTLVGPSRQPAQAIAAGEFPPGSKLPSELRLAEIHGSAARSFEEAISGPEADRLVEARQGAGVFILNPQPWPSIPSFESSILRRMSSVIELLELRTAVETEAAGLGSTAQITRPRRR